MKNLLLLFVVLLSTSCITYRDIAKAQAEMAEYVQEQNRIQDIEIRFTTILGAEQVFITYVSEQTTLIGTAYTLQIRHPSPKGAVTGFYVITYDSRQQKIVDIRLK